MHLWGCVIPVMPVLFWQTQCQKDGSLDMGLYGDYGDVDSDVVRELSTISSTVDDIVMSGDMNTKGDYGTLKDFDYGSQLPFPSTTDPKLANDEPTTTTYVENLDFDYASEQSTSSTTDPKLAEDKQTTKAYVENVDLDNGSELLVTSKTDPKLADDKQTTTAYVESMGLESGSDPSVPSTVDPKSGSTKQTTTQDVKYLDFDYGKPAAESGDTTAKVTTPGKGEKTTTPKKAKATTVSKPKDTTTTTTYDFSNVDFSNMDYDQMAAISNAWILSLFGPPSDSATSPPTADPGAVEKKVFDATDGKSGSGSDTDSKPVDDKIGNGTVDDKSWNGTDSLQDGNGTLVDSNITTTTPYPGIDCDDEKQKPLSDLLDELRSLPNTSSAFERRCQVLIMCFKNPPPDMDFEIDTIPGNETDGSSTTVTSTTTTVTDSLPDSTTPDYGEFADFTMADCSRDTGPANASSDPDVQMRSLWASIFRLKLNFTRPLDPSLGSIAPQYSEYVSVLFNYNFPRTMQENYQAKTGKPLVRLAQRRVRVTGLSNGRTGDPVLNAPCYRKYIQDQTMNFRLKNYEPSDLEYFDICVCQKVEFNPTATFLAGDTQAVASNAVTQRRGQQSVGGQWITLDVTHVTPDVCIDPSGGQGTVTGCCDPDPRAVPRDDVAAYAQINGAYYFDKAMAAEMTSLFLIPNTTDFQPWDEVEAFRESDRWLMGDARDRTFLREFLD